MLTYSHSAHKEYMKYLTDKKDLETQARKNAEMEKAALKNDSIRIEKNNRRENVKMRIKEVKAKIDAAAKLIKEGNENISTGLSTKCHVYITDGRQKMAKGIEERIQYEKELNNLENELSNVSFSNYYFDNNSTIFLFFQT